jgi:hypothetical protein
MRKPNEISLPLIAQVLQRVLTQQITREEASNWAFQVRIGLEAGQITFTPASMERQIWETVLFLEGIDLQDAPGSYLHNEADMSHHLEQLSQRRITPNNL